MGGQVEQWEQHQGRGHLRGAARSGRLEGESGAHRQRQGERGHEPLEKGWQGVAVRRVDQGRSVRAGAGDRDRRALGYDQGRADRGAAQALTRLLIYAALTTSLAGPAQADETFALPSGLTVFLHEVSGTGRG